jgi:hypothetical protein
MAENGTQGIKNLLLNLPPFTLARTNRDLFGNLTMMWAKGFKHPESFTEAAKAQKALTKALKSGKTLEEAIATLPPEAQKLEKDMSKYGVVETGRFAQMFHTQI